MFCALAVLAFSPEGRAQGGYARGQGWSVAEPGEVRPLAEPRIPLVEFAVYPPPTTLRGRVERLIHGIVMHLPPEYDHYGYAIRFYMAGVLNPAIFVDEARLELELENIRRAQEVLNRWRIKLTQDIAQIESEMAEAGPSSSVRSGFRYNQGVVGAFLTECGAWLDGNQKLLEFLIRIGPKAYTYRDSSVTLWKTVHHKEFVTLYRTREKALEAIQSYTDFGVMVY